MSDEYVPYVEDEQEQEYPLRDGGTTLDPRLDRIEQFDEASRNYPVMEAISDTTPRSYTWRCFFWNDQGREGACVGFAFSHELAARPVVIPTDNSYAMGIYKRAQQLDPWPGENYSGTSVLAGVKATQELLTAKGEAIMPEYRWAFGVDDLVVAVGRKGPAVIGCNWYRNMFRPDANGFIHPTGQLLGGHAILVFGVKIVKLDPKAPISLENMDRDKSYFKLRNSWGKDWGKNGDCYLTVRDMDFLLQQRGEAVIPVIRKGKRPR